MGTPRYRQLTPPGPALSARSYLEPLALRGRGEHRGRPYTIANFVSSADGRATVGEDSRALSSAADRELFYTLRERADAVLAGPRTLAAERYKRLLPDAARRDRRLASGLPAEPLLVTISRSGRLPLQIPLFAQAGARALVFSPAPAVAARLAATVAHAPLTTLPATLQSLRSEHGVGLLLCEGGPTLFGALLRAGLIDELFLTLAPRLSGGAPGPAVVSGPPPEPPAQARLAAVLEHDGTLFLRYRLRPGRAGLRASGAEP